MFHPSDGFRPLFIFFLSLLGKLIQRTLLTSTTLLFFPHTPAASLPAYLQSLRRA